MSKTVYRWTMIGFKLMGIAFLCVCSCAIGVLSGGNSRYLAQSQERRDAVRPILVNDPSFTNLEILISDGGDILIVGKVKSRDDFARLKKLAVEAIGKQRAEHAIISVEVEEKLAHR